MALELELKRTIGTVYGGIMRDSEIRFPNGNYISAHTFAMIYTVG